MKATFDKKTDREDRRPTITAIQAIKVMDGNQAKLAKLLGVSRQYVGQLKRSRSVLSTKHSQAVADVAPDAVRWVRG